MPEQSISRRGLTEVQAAHYCGMSVRYLRQARAYPNKGCPGPTFAKLGRSVRYLVDDLDLWLDAHRKPGVPLDAPRANGPHSCRCAIVGG